MLFLLKLKFLLLVGEYLHLIKHGYHLHTDIKRPIKFHEILRIFFFTYCIHNVFVAAVLAQGGQTNISLDRIWGSNNAI